LPHLSHSLTQRAGHSTQRQATALSLLFEFAIQRGTLRHLLSLIHLLIQLWECGHGVIPDNRTANDFWNENGIPLIPFLRRFEAISAREDILPQDEECDVNATACFLRYLEYPQDENSQIDLYQSAVIIMSHIDRIAESHQPKISKLSSLDDISASPNISKLHIRWHAGNLFRRPPEEGICLNNVLQDNISIKSLLPIWNYILILSECGKVYAKAIDSNVHDFGSRILEKCSEHTIAQLWCSPDGKTCFLSEQGALLAWNPFDAEDACLYSSEDPIVISSLSDKDIIEARVVSNNYFALSSNGEIYSWSLVKGTKIYLAPFVVECLR
ncbi:Uncharacterized protein FKW44_002488, partial [Caligus rogercresseyi]